MSNSAYDSVEDASLLTVSRTLDILFEMLPRMCIDLWLRAMRTFEHISLIDSWDGYHSSCRVNTRISHPVLALEWLHYFEFTLVFYTIVSRSAL